MDNKDYLDIMQCCGYLDVNAIYFNLRFKYNLDIKKSLQEFINVLWQFSIQNIIVVKFIDPHYNLPEDASLEEKLNYVYNSFPSEFNPKTPETDIDGLWWEFHCPIAIGWWHEVEDIFWID